MRTSRKLYGARSARTQRSPVLLMLRNSTWCRKLGSKQDAHKPINRLWIPAATDCEATRKAFRTSVFVDQWAGHQLVFGALIDCLIEESQGAGAGCLLTHVSLLSELKVIPEEGGMDEFANECGVHTADVKRSTSTYAASERCRPALCESPCMEKLERGKA